MCPCPSVRRLRRPSCPRSRTSLQRSRILPGEVCAMSGTDRTEALQRDAMRHVLISLSHYEDVERSGIKIIERGEGCYIYDTDGRKYLDTFASLLTTICGHHRPEVHEAMLEQMRRIEFFPVYHDCMTPPVIELAKRLAELAPGDLEVSYFVSDGSDATESAIKMARQYFHEIDQPGRSKILYRRHSYHGASMGAMAATGLQWFREPYPPLAPGFVQVMAPNPYRCEMGLDPEESARMALRNTEAIIEWEGPESIAAMILDPVPGSNVGYPVPPDFYLPELKALCDRHGILTIYDEIQVGMGKTGRMFCCEHWDVTPHFMCLAKGFAAGFAPMAAVLTTTEIADVFRRPGPDFRHGHTYSGHPVSAAAVLAVLD
ncbi:MAG: aminotransferase class III-fold pyridoxal phosphate-dependent enzyme, partial [Armatimonadia bacterium]|nr:aminotransferase class III-fold pyridoxal phosphate-dependent enzyme [Armatimonadia bacterium]